MNQITKFIRDHLIEQLNLPTDEEQERLRIELYKTLQTVVTNIRLERNSIVLDVSALNEVLQRYGYQIMHGSVEIPIVRSASSNHRFITKKELLDLGNKSNER